MTKGPINNIFPGFSRKLRLPLKRIRQSNQNKSDLLIDCFINQPITGNPKAEVHVQPKAPNRG